MWTRHTPSGGISRRRLCCRCDGSGCAVRCRRSSRRRRRSCGCCTWPVTRAKDKLILTLCLANAERTLNGLREYTGPHPDPRALLQRDSVGEWLLLPVLARDDAEELWTAGPPEERIVPPDRWDIRLCTLDSAGLSSGPAVQPPVSEKERAETDLMSCAAMLIAISAGVSLPISIPIGA